MTGEDAQLVCVECGATSTHEAPGWKAEIGDDPREDDPPEPVVYCPTCWEREFGGASLRIRV